MRITLTRIFALALLTMVSLGAKADIDVKIGTFTGGKITAEQKGDDTKVTVTLTVTPDKANGYKISKKDIYVYATLSPNGSRSDGEPEISSRLDLDGKDPKDLSDERKYTVTVESTYGVWVKEAKFDNDSKGDSSRGIITLTTDLNNPVYYLIQSYQNTGFYMRPNGTKVTTLNSLTDEMKWFFLDAGKENEGTENEKQYYYICRKNGNNTQYMYFSGPDFISTSSRIWIELKTSITDIEEYCKFSIAPNTDIGGYNIIPKGTNTSNPSSLNKQGRNAGNNGIQVGGGLNDEASCWNIIAVSSFTWTLLPECFIVSDNSNRYYYKIKSQNNASFFIKPGTTYVETSNSPDDNMNWYFTEADHNDLTTYYYIIHANTGKYLRYRENTVGNANAIELSDHTGNETGNEEKRFLFIVVRGANADESIANPKGITFNIIPKTFENTSANYIRSISCDKGLGEPLATYQHRSASTTHWNFERVEVNSVCANPTITFSNTTGKVSISTETAYSTIYYTTDGTEPSSTNGTEYVDPFDVTEPTTIKAIATRNGFTDSGVTSLTLSKVATPIIQDNGSNAISITCETEGATIYYTTDGSDPTPSSTEYTGALKDDVSGKTIKAIAVKNGFINSEIGSGSVTLKCDPPVITKGQGVVTITCAFPSTGVTIYYTKNGGEPSSSSPQYTEPISIVDGDVIKAIAMADGYDNSDVVSKTIVKELEPIGDIYYIKDQSNFATFLDMVSNAEGASYHYVLQTDVTAGQAITQPFTGILEAEADANGNYYKISGLTHALFNTIDGGTVKNIILDDVTISSGTNVGAICNEATGASRIYNCGVLGNLTETKDENGKVTNITSTSTISGTGYVGSIVGLLDGTSRVINCYSFAKVSGGSVNAGIVGYNNQSSTQDNLKTVVVNCMFYGDISGSGYPVYGGYSINNDDNSGINPYCYFRKNATFTVTDYNRSWPAEEKNLTRFEYYRSILNSNRKLCTWWVNGTDGTTPTDDDVSDVGIAKWVLDPSIAPYPILKAWGKYPSIINLDPTRIWDPRTEDADGNPMIPHWVQRSSANAWEGKSFNTLSVTINAGSHGSGSDTRDITITDMDTLNCDYGYYKIQLPYYNDVFGNPNGDTHAAKYAGNYTDYVVTGWEISGGSNAENYNFADRNSYNGRIFAQGGYFYVPDGVTSISITAHWGKAVYLANRGYSIDRVNVTAGDYRKADKSEANNFAPAGTVSNKFQSYDVYDDLQSAINALGSGPTVYDQAIVLIGNHQVKNGSESVAGSSGKWHPFTIMSVDLDFDDEPDYCLQLQFRKGTDRPGIQPVRFDFLPVIELGLAVRHNNLAYAIGVMVPQGHFEITETAFMRTTQFEWDANVTRFESESPVILNGGEFEQLAVRTVVGNRTSYFLLGGHLWFHRFAPGSHPIASSSGNPRLCPVNVIGGDFPEFYLSGLYRPDKTPPNDQGNPKCYIDGGHFGKIHGAGYDKINGSVTFKINHAVIGEFYGGGINGSNPIGGNIDVTIDNSRVDKYCGGPEVGDMTGRIVKTDATGTTFGVFYGGGNGGNSYYRQLQKDGDQSSSHINTWTDKDYNWDVFNPLGVKDDDVDNENKGYHAEYEFEVFNQSNGVTDEITQRGFIKWIQFGITKTGNVTNTLSNCKITNNFYGGGNLATVDGTVISTLTNTQVNGNVFGAGYSAAIPTFQVHDKSKVSFPSITAGVITDGHIDYDSRVFEWTNDLNGKTEEERKAAPTYEKDGKWYCYTWNSLANLGAVTGKVTLNIEGTTTVKESVYGGGEESGVDGDTEVNVKGGTIGYKNAPVYEDKVGNVYGAGKGLADNVKAGLVKGNTKVTIEGDAESPLIYHNIYGGGAYGSVGTYTYTDNIITGYTSGGKCEVYVKGGQIGIDGHNNGMVFGSSRGDVQAPVNGVDFNDYLAWVHDTHVVIGTSGSDDGPQIKGSVYGGGENGHTYQNTVVDIHSGMIGVVEIGKKDAERYTSRGNIYGGGCGTDTYDVSGKTYYNLNAGIVLGTTTVNIDGGHVVRNVYGAGSMGSVGTFTLDTDDSNNILDGKPVSSASGTGICNVNISGGMIGSPGAKMHYDDLNTGPDDFGHVFGAGRGETRDSTVYVNLNIVGYVKESHVTISNKAFITGSVYGGSESGHVLGDTHVTVSGGQIGCADNLSEPYSDSDWTKTSLAECAHWPYSGTYAPFDKFSGDSGYDLNAAKGGAKKATNGQTFNGNVFGGGSGLYPYAPGKWVRSAGLVEGNTNVEISGGHILTNVYGGNEHTDVYGTCTVEISGGTVGVPLTYAQKRAHPVTGNVFGAGKGDKRVLFNTWTNVKETVVNVSGGTIYGGVYGGGEDGHVLGDAKTTISQPDGNTTIIGTLGTTGYDGNVYGGGRGSYTALTAGVVCGNTEVNIEGGKLMGSVYGGGRLASVGTYLVPPTKSGTSDTENPKYGQLISDGKQQIIRRTVVDNQEVMENDDMDAAGVTHGHMVVNIKGGTIGAVDEDGKLLNSSFSIGDVYGACKGTTNGNYGTSYNSHDSEAQVRLGVSKSAIVNLLGGTVGNSIYGGGELGNIGTTGSTGPFYAKINLLGGTVKNVYGGGLGQKSGVNGATVDAETLVMGDVKVNLNGLESEDYDDAIHNTAVSPLDEDGTSGTDFYRVGTRGNGCKVTGNIFGCNNINGTPTGHAKVHVFMTTPREGQEYDVAAVYGGGNQADYVPNAADAQQKTEVIIEGCGLTNIQQVYGGGNAAATPGTLVLIKGTELIDEVFGGGNGVSTTGFENPGANIGYRTGTTTAYGGDQGGKALVQLMAGNVNSAYGGSNTKGDIRSGSNVETVDNAWRTNATACCENLQVGYVFGGGKNAGMKSGANIILGCSNSTSWVKEIYAGAENADVEGDCSLTITSGKFGRVFGGNKTSGKLMGSITVNIEENGQCGIPVIIGELYGGGNKAPYSIYGYNGDGTPKSSGENPKASPVVNVRAFTSIGNIYGGGYGAEAVMYGSPTVNINEIPNHKDGADFNGNAFSGTTLYFKNDILDVSITADPDDMTNIQKVVVPSHEDKKMGAIQNVFGGGNAAAVYGNTQVNIAVTSTEPLQQLDAQGNPKYTDTAKTIPAKDTVTVVGADIRGNVYGGGNEAEVIGSTNVVIGKEGATE